MTPTGHYMTLHGEKYYLIEHFDRMSPFFISLAWPPTVYRRRLVIIVYCVDYQGI